MQRSKHSVSYYQILLLILAGESVFILPFVLARIFRPTFLDVFELTNLQLGSCFSIYGVVALLSYVYGGTLADKFAPRKLISISLILTAFGGLLMATFPSNLMLKIIYGYWGFTTVFLFWGAMIKGTRVWGGVMQQGKAFGLLEGGRGFVAASIGAVGVFIFSIILPDNIENTSLIDRKEAFRYVILFTSILAIVVGGLVFLFMEDQNRSSSKQKSDTYSISNIQKVIKNESVLWLMLIVLASYVGYKITDIFSLYASEVMLFSEVEAAQVGTFQLYLRPLICVSIGLLADRTRGATWIINGFVIMLVGALLFASGLVKSGASLFFILSLITTTTGVYALRTLYFAVFQEGYIPLGLTGTAVGVISVIGYTPDIFIGPIMGYLLDESPGLYGHQQVFMVLSVFSILGIFAAIKFSRLKNEKI
ncbi:MAG: MFS transporter [Flavobacteriaceae bacterium]|nr:MFS transporter [Flavobacteriaceae bacterium]